jgi:reactive intermediate/imine deaminase
MVSSYRGRTVVAAADAPKAVGPYSQAVLLGNRLFCSGQIPLDPATGELITGGFEAQVRRVFDNLAAVLAAARMGFDDVVKVTVFLTDIATFPILNDVYAQVFKEPYPARAVVGVAALPKGAELEIELTAEASG